MKKLVNIVIPFLVVLVVLMLGIGYSVSNKDIFIKSISAVVRPVEDIRVTGISVYSSSTGSISNENYNVHNINGNITLPNSTSYVKYKVDITNIGNTVMGIDSLSGLPSNLDYTLEDYNLKDKLCDTSGNCTLGAKKSFYITIKYKDGGYSSSNTNYNFLLDFAFKKMYDVTITGMDDGFQYSKNIIDGGTYRVDVGTGLTTSAITVNMGGVDTSDFTYADGILEIPNVMGDLSISIFNIQNVEFVMDASHPSISAPVNAPTLNDFITLSFDGYNSTPRYISSVTVDIVYNYSSGGSGQYVDYGLEYMSNGKKVTLPTSSDSPKRLAFDKKGNNQKASIQFTGLSIPSNTLFTVKTVNSSVNNGKPKVTSMTISVTFSD